MKRAIFARLGAMKSAWIGLTSHGQAVWPRSALCFDGQGEDRTSVRVGSAHSLCAPCIADDFEFDPVRIEEVEALTGVIVVMPKRLEAGLCDDGFGAIQIIDREGDVIEWRSLAVLACDMITGLGCQVIVIVTHVDGPAILLAIAAPTFVPAEKILEQCCAALRGGYRDIDVFEFPFGHQIILSSVVPGRARIAFHLTCPLCNLNLS